MLKYFLIKKKMNNIYKYFFCLLIVMISLNSCQSVKDGLSGKKKNSADEFLVKKKNPLVLPPEFEKLPKPKSLNINEKIEKEEDINLESIFGEKSNTDESTSENKKINTSVEKSIIEKIKDN
jgi:hypothetical protein